MNKNLLTHLTSLGLRQDEAKVYLTLLEQPATHLQIARKSGVNRTKIYRIADDLKHRGLIAAHTEDDGKKLIATSPRNLEYALDTEAQKITKRLNILHSSLPELESIFANRPLATSLDFSVTTYEGIDGFKQMLWNELKAKDMVSIFGYGSIEDLVGGDHSWAERHRTKTLERGYHMHELTNPEGKDYRFTDIDQFAEIYTCRSISRTILPLHHQTAIYNNTVAIYNWRGDHRVGLEIHNPDYATMMRAMFEHYWTLATL